MGEHRWLKFWPQDWQRDPALRCCSLAARGMWIEMICLMHDGDPYGHLTVSGRPVSAKQLGTLTGAGEKEASRLLAELEEAGVFSRTAEGTIFCRRMLRDKAASDAGKEHGKTGGNPSLTKPDKPPGKGGGKQGGLTPPHNGRLNGGPNLQEAEAESEAEAEPPYPHSDGSPPMPDRYRLPDVVWKPDKDRNGVVAWHAVVAGWHLDTTWDRIALEAGYDPDGWGGDLSPLVQWLKDDIPAPDIVAAVKRCAARDGYKPPRSLRYFDPAVRENRHAH